MLSLTLSCCSRVLLSGIYDTHNPILPSHHLQLTSFPILRLTSLDMLLGQHLARTGNLKRLRRQRNSNEPRRLRLRRIMPLVHSPTLNNMILYMPNPSANHISIHIQIRNSKKSRVLPTQLLPKNPRNEDTKKAKEEVEEEEGRTPGFRSIISPASVSMRRWPWVQIT